MNNSIIHNITLCINRLRSKLSFTDNSTFLQDDSMQSIISMVCREAGREGSNLTVNIYFNNNNNSSTRNVYGSTLNIDEYKEAGQAN